MKEYVQKVQGFIKRHEEALLPLFLLFGFAVDGLTLRRVDLLPETLLIYGYLILSGVTLLLVHLHEEKVWKGGIAEQAAPFLPLAFQYAIGSLFSAFVIFYVKSASIADSWPFIVVLISVVIGIEVLKKYPHRLVFNLTVYFLAVFSFAIFTVPLWVGTMGTEVFLLSAGFALAVFAVYARFFFMSGKNRMQGIFKPLVASVLSALLVVSVLYSANILPPIPLALKDIGVYHTVVKEGDEYAVRGEQYSLFDRVLGMTVHLPQGAPLYVFSSVFTPIAIQTDIVHRWERFDTEEKKWVEYAVVPFPVGGGRDGGYRGFSFIRSVSHGLWRVSVETPDGLKIGRIEFTVRGGKTPVLIEEVR